MKKIVFIILSFTILYSSCKKSNDSPNPNSTLLLSKVTFMTQGLTRVTTLTYDNSNRLSSMANNFGIVNFSYNQNGNLIRRYYISPYSNKDLNYTYHNDSVISSSGTIFKLNAKKLVESVIYTSGSRREFLYDELGNVKKYRLYDNRDSVPGTYYVNKFDNYKHPYSMIGCKNLFIVNDFDLMDEFRLLSLESMVNNIISTDSTLLIKYKYNEYGFPTEANYHYVWNASEDYTLYFEYIRK